jgi:hypothetical protein
MAQGKGKEAKETSVPTGTPAVRAERGGAGTILVELPVVPEVTRARIFHLQAHLQDRHATALGRFREGLWGENARFRDGQPVSSPADCVRYLLEKMADAMGIPE